MKTDIANVTETSSAVKPKRLKPEEIKLRLLRGGYTELHEWDPRGLSIQEVEEIEGRKFTLEDYFETLDWYDSSNSERDNGSYFDRLLSFDRHEKNKNDSILGDRLLCEGGSLVLNGASGIGKSSLKLQAAICWVLGRDFFGIKPRRSLRILFIQSENDFGDIAIAVQDMTGAMRLTDAELQTLKTNLVIRQETSRTGTAFVKYAADQISIENEQISARADADDNWKYEDGWKIDLVIADPLLSFIGGDVTRQDVVSKFLRNEIQLLLKMSGVAWIWTHHTNKPRDGRGGRTGDERMYFGNGSSEITNWARVIMTLERKNGDQFWLSIDKREKHSPWTDKDGKRVNGIAIQHSKDGVVWERTNGNTPISVNLDSVMKSDRQKAAVRDFIVEHETVAASVLRSNASKVGENVAINRICDIANAIVQEASEPRIYAYKSNAVSGTNKGIVYSTQPPPVERLTKKKRRIDTARLDSNA